MRAAVAAGVAVAAGIANVAKILQTPTPGGGGGGGGSTPTAPNIPQFNPDAALAQNVEGGLVQNEAGINQTGSTTSQVIKTYVVAADVTSAQEASKKIFDLARL